MRQTLFPINHVIMSFPANRVILRASVNYVILRTSVNHVILRVSVNYVILRASVNHVILRASVNYVILSERSESKNLLRPFGFAQGDKRRASLRVTNGGHRSAKHKGTAQKVSGLKIFKLLKLKIQHKTGGILVPCWN